VLSSCATFTVSAAAVEEAIVASVSALAGTSLQPVITRLANVTSVKYRIIMCEVFIFLFF
jgi:hypothetical protein